MAKTSLIITSTDQFGKGLQKTVTDVNPDATSAQLVTFATKLNALTTNSYVRTDRVDKTNCDTEASGKQTPTFTLDKYTASASSIQNGNAYFKITYSGDGQIYFGDINVDAQGLATGCDYNFSPFSYSDPTLSFWLLPHSGSTVVPFTFKLMATETATYKAAEITVTITE